MLMKKNYFRRNRSNVLMVIAIILLSFIALQQKLIKIENTTLDFHLTVLTINAIFAGFLFTSLGIMVSFLDRERVKRLDRAGYMDNYYNSIYIGLLFHVVSIFCALLVLIIPNLDQLSLLLQLEQLFLFAGVIFFVKSVINIGRIINKVRNSED